MLESFRQRINDSDIGSRINNSGLGLFIECISLKVAEFFKPVEYFTKYSFARLIGEVDPRFGQLIYGIFFLGEIEDFQTKYSNRSKLWKKERIGPIIGYDRVPLNEAIVNRNSAQEELKLPSLEEALNEIAKTSESEESFFIPDYSTADGAPKYMN